MKLSDLISEVEEVNNRMLLAADEGDWELFLSIAESRSKKLDPLKNKLIEISGQIVEVSDSDASRISMIMESNSALQEIIELRLEVLGRHLSRISTAGDMERYYVAVGTTT